MNKNQYLEELRKELKANNVSDIEDIISEYEQHFAFKLEEGATEEEISRKLSSPKEIAREYVKNENINNNKYEKGIKLTGIVFMSIPLFFVYALMFASVIVIGAFSVVSVATGFCLISTINVGGLIPSLPYFPAFILGLSLFSLALLSGVGTFYLFMYIKQWGKIYLRWCFNLINNNHYPTISKHPNISKKLSSKLKLIAVICLVIFIVMLTIGYFSLCISAGSLEPWHVYNWFK